MSKFEEIIKKAKEASLKSEEKAQMRAELFAFMKKADVREVQPARRIFRLFKPIPAFATFLIITTLAGGVSLASENSLPGDVLYPLKVSFNEEVRSALTLSGESKTDWEVRRAERRVEEAERLAEKGKLSKEVKIKIEANFERQAERAKIKIARTKEISELRVEKAAFQAADMRAVAPSSDEKINQRIERAREKLKLEIMNKITREKGREELSKEENND